MAPGYDVDDDAAHLLVAGNGNAAKSIPTGTVDDELFAKVLPRVDNGAIHAARLAFGNESEDESEDEARRRPQRGRSLSESSIMVGAVGSHSERDTDIPVEGPGGREASRPGRDSMEFNPPARPLSRGDLMPPDFSHSRPDRDIVAVPARGSSRPDRGSIDSSGRIASRRDYNIPQRPPRAEDIEAARRILAQAGEGDYYSSKSPRGAAHSSPRAARSATPPPIGRPHRRIIYDESDEEDDEDFSDRTYHDEIRDEDAEPPPISQRRPDPPRSRRTTYKVYNMDDDQDQDYSVKNGLAARLTPDYRPGTGDRRAMSDDSISISRQSTSKQSVTSNGSGSNRTVDFFGPGIFQVVLHNPTTSHQLLKFAEARFCSESVEFLKKVEQYHTTLNDLAGIMTSIHKDFLAESSSKQINVNGEMRKQVHVEMKALMTKTLPSMESLFSDLQESVEQDVFLDIYPRFVRYQMALNATRALATNRHTYQGLGDCFCLTNPSVADNPIVFASDGFVKVTGYTRPEIIPRNCRFLQGAHTDRVPIRRLKNAIEERKESVELILNYKKNGDPFWNLLYVAPLYNEAGKLAFFIGGQINCSTTIHSNVDVMRVLSTSTNDDTQDETKANAPPIHRASSMPSARKAFLKALGVRVDSNNAPTTVTAEAGMENKLLHRMEGQSLNAQMKEFYTAYSKYLVLSYDSFIIRFYSEGVMEMLHPANNTIGLVTGQEIFRFFKQNMVNHQSDYKARVRSAIRSGSPISMEIRLQTRRSALFRGDEKFMTHWTPLKDDKSAVHYVVLTMAPAIQ
ncbi:Aureochrome1 [Colletotrichum sp. SAR11_239]|nr:Aureochrome1 [Colletotrichum sp. SAR11_239]